MPVLYDKTNKQAVRLAPDQAADLIMNDNPNYMPIVGWKYTVEDSQTGNQEEVTGDALRQRLWKGSALKDTRQARMSKVVRSQNTPWGVFAKSTLDSALLGIPGIIKGGPKNELESLRDETFQKEFGFAHGAGQVAGFVGPALAGGIGGAIAKRALTKGLSKVASAIPSAAAIRGIDKLGMATANAARKAAMKMGVKNKAALSLVSGAGRASGWALGDTALFATKAGIDAGQNARYDRSFDLKAALSEGKRAAPEIFSTSFLFSGGVLASFRGMGLAGQGFGKVAGGTGRFIGKKVGDSDLGLMLRNMFFNTPNSQKAMGNLKENIGNSYRYLSKELPDDSVKQLWNSVPEPIKKQVLKGKDPSLSFMRENIKEVIKNSSEKEVLSFMRTYFKDSLKKIPVTRKEGFNLLNEKRAKVSHYIENMRGGFFEKFKDAQLKSNKLKKTFKDSESLWKSLLLENEQMSIKTLKEFQNLSIKANKLTVKDVTTPLSKMGFESNAHKELWRNVLSLSKEDVRRASFVDKIRDFRNLKGFAKPKISSSDWNERLDTFLNWVTAQSSDVKGVKSALDFLKKENQSELFKKWGTLKLPKKILPLIHQELSKSINKNPHITETVFDMYKANFILNKKALNVVDFNSFNKIVSKYSESHTVKIPSNVAKVKDVMAEYFDEIIPSYLKVSGNQMHKLVNTLQKNIHDFEKVTTAKGFVRESNKIKGLMRTHKLSLENFKKKGFLNISDINKLMNISSQMSDFVKKTQPSPNQSNWRKFYHQLSELEDNMFDKFSEANIKFKEGVSGITSSKTIGKDFIKAKGEYSLTRTMMEVLDRPVISMGTGGTVNFRDMVFYSGVGGGGAAIAMGAPLIGIGIVGTAWAASKAVHGALARGSYFLHAADAIDGFSSFVKRQRSTFEKFRDKKKLSSFLNSGSNISGLSISRATLSALFFQKETANFEEFADALLSRSPVDNLTSGTEDVYSMIEAVGGTDSANSMNKKVTDLKQYVLSVLPKGSVNPISGKKSYSKLDQMKFFDQVSRVIDPSNFLNDFKGGKISLRQVESFSLLYPEHRNALALSIVEGLRDGTLKPTLKSKRAINVLLNNKTDAFLWFQDSIKKEEREEQKQQQRSGGVKFSSYTQPTKEQRVAQA